MEDNFHNSEHLPKERLMKLIKKNNSPAGFRFALMYLFILLSAFALIMSWGQNIWLILLAHIAFALGFCSSFACEHETIHGTAFKNKSLNKMAAFLCGIVQLYPPTMFRELHFTHHRYTHIPGKDPEISFGGKPIPSTVSSLPMYLSWISGLPLFLFKFIMLFGGILTMPDFFKNAIFPFFRKSMRTQLFIESLLILVIYILIVISAIYLHQGFWFIFSGLALGHCILATYLAPEHNGLPHEGNIMDKTRSMKTNIFVRTLMWNMPYHAEHHAYPAVPFHALPELRKELEAEIKNLENYPGFHLKAISGKLK
jgi:fatty acid desaturase